MITIHLVAMMLMRAIVVHAVVRGATHIGQTVLIGRRRRMQLQNRLQCRDVTLRHLQGLVFGEASLLLKHRRRQDGAKMIERRVQTVHTATFTGIGGDASCLFHVNHHGAAGSFAHR